MNPAVSFRLGQMPGQKAQDQHAGELVGMQSSLQIGFPARTRFNSPVAALLPAGCTEAQYGQPMRRVGQIVVLALHYRAQSCAASGSMNISVS